jgi:hypothetical protein
MKDRIKELYEKIKPHKNLILSSAVALGINLSFRELNNYLFPVRDVIAEILSKKDLEAVKTWLYFEGQKDLFQGATGNAGYELMKNPYLTKFRKHFSKLFSDQNSLKFRAVSCALGGAIVELGRTAIGLIYTEILKQDPIYVYKYLIEPRSEAPWEIARSVVFGLIFLCIADYFRKTKKSLNI